MKYQFLDPGADKLVEESELPTEGVIALAIRATGYDTEDDEVVALSIVDLNGKELFAKTVKPQNKEEWGVSDASGNITPADVAEAPELFQFEEEISDLFENATLVVAQSTSFAEGIIEQSWVTLPAFEGFDLVERFRAAHCTADYLGEPAAAASLQGIAEYYGLPAERPTLTDEARMVAQAYQAYVKEHVDERAARGPEYWKDHDERKAEENARIEAANAVIRKREKNFNRMNGLLWVAAGIIFTSLVIQLYQRGGDTGLMVVCGAFAVFAYFRAVANFRR